MQQSKNASDIFSIQTPRTIHRFSNSEIRKLLVKKKFQHPSVTFINEFNSPNLRVCGGRTKETVRLYVLQAVKDIGRKNVNLFYI